MRRSVKARMSDFASALYREIYDMEPRQRTAALKALNGLTTTNCNWILYELRLPLIRLIDAASSSRERAARRKRDEREGK